jgi:hypothetical protein
MMKHALTPVLLQDGGSPIKLEGKSGKKQKTFR